MYWTSGRVTNVQNQKFRVRVNFDMTFKYLYLIDQKKDINFNWLNFLFEDDDNPMRYPKYVSRKSRFSVIIKET